MVNTIYEVAEDGRAKITFFLKKKKTVRPHNTFKSYAEANSDSLTIFLGNCR